MDFVSRNQKQLMWGFGILFGFIALITSPIWITMVVLSSPFIIAGVLLFMYTDHLAHSRDSGLNLYFHYTLSTIRRMIKFSQMLGTQNQIPKMEYSQKHSKTMNYFYYNFVFLTQQQQGYDQKDSAITFTYKLKDKFDVLRFQLYNYIVMRFGGVNSMNGLSLLETGCGRGGGIHYLARELNPQQALGIDHAQPQIDYCRKHWMGDKLNINFIQHKVEDISSIISKNTIDYAVDIESSVFYPNKQRLSINNNYNIYKDSIVKQARSQRKMEHFYMEQLQCKQKQYLLNCICLLNDASLPNEEYREKSYQLNDKYLISQPYLFQNKVQFDIVKSEDITQEVVKALKLGTQGFTDLIENNFPKWTHWFLKQAYGLEGTYIHKLMERRVIIYKCYQCTNKK